ncbi:MAG: hypothetical protein Q9225_004365 [Loekoesia sp. 1 TL-2023]
MNTSAPDMHDICFHDDNANTFWDRNETNRNNDTHAHSMQQAAAGRDRRYNRRKTRAEWEQIKADLKKLYVEEDRSLEETMSELQVKCGFRASQHQFKSKIKEWKFDKKVKTKEMKHLIRIRNKRLPKETNFRVRGKLVNAAKIERFERTHPTSSDLSPSTHSAISYKTSDSPEGMPPLDRLSISPPKSLTRSTSKATAIARADHHLAAFLARDVNLLVTPQLEDVEWYRDYQVYRSKSPRFFIVPVCQKLQELRVVVHTFKMWTSRLLKSQGLQTLLEEIQSGNHEDNALARRTNCPVCTVKGVMQLNDICRNSGEKDFQDLPVRPDLLWWVSEILKLLQSMGLIEGNPQFVSQVGFKMYRISGSEDVQEKHLALHLVDHVIIRGQLRAAEEFLKEVLQEDFDRIDSPSREPLPDPGWSTETCTHSLYLRRATIHLAIIRWFQARSDLTQKIFGCWGIPKSFVTRCGGLQINDHHFCFISALNSHHDCVSYGERFSEEWFTEEDWITRRLIQGLDFNEYEQHRMRILLGLSRYLLRCGESMFDSTIVEVSNNKIIDKDGRVSSAEYRESKFDLERANDNPFSGPQADEFLLGMEQGEFGWGDVGSQEELFAGFRENSSAFNCKSNDPQIGGYTAGVSQSGLGEQGMSINVEPFAQHRGFSPPSFTFTEQRNRPSFEGMNRTEFMREEIQTGPGLFADWLNTPFRSPSIFDEPQISQDLHDWQFGQEQTRMVTDPDTFFGENSSMTKRL